MPDNAMTLDEAASWAAKLRRPSPYAFKNAMRTIGSLFKSGKAKKGRYQIQWGIRKAFQHHVTLSGKPWARLAPDTRYRGRKVDRSRPLYRPGQGVKTLQKIMTRRGFSHRGGRHVEFFRGGANPKMVLGGSGILPSVHQNGQRRTINVFVGGEARPKTIKVPARPLVEVSPLMATRAAEIMADAYMKAIEHGAF